jgi:hypothetical protein
MSKTLADLNVGDKIFWRDGDVFVVRCKKR